ncbi:MAG: hypothetical protein IVW57_02675 [Ktedonobacterales bacterium]|nr:hypothetical protein [Ktedonobacterales bacterium]
MRFRAAALAILVMAFLLRDAALLLAAMGGGLLADSPHPAGGPDGPRMTVSGLPLPSVTFHVPSDGFALTGPEAAAKEVAAPPASTSALAASSNAHAPAAGRDLLPSSADAPRPPRICELPPPPVAPLLPLWESMAHLLTTDTRGFSFSEAALVGIADHVPIGRWAWWHDARYHTFGFSPNLFIPPG